ncbi:MAG TPA: hypothetical protein VN958_05575 [Chitinophagaceae bacterium]|nr:hypothetical protein [Chitinophagaceae bacterium]
MLFCISDSLQCSQYFLNVWQSNFSSQSAAETFLPGILNFSKAWHTAATFPFKTLINIWFEYDFDNIQKNNLKPSFFYAPAKGTHPFAVLTTSETILQTISREPVSKETLIHLLHCLNEVPENGWVSQIGRMFARGEESVRLFIQQIPRNGIRTYLDKIGYVYASEYELNLLLKNCYEFSDHVDLDIDVIHITGDTIGLECSFNEMEHALDFLDHLFSNRFCTQQKYEALNRYLRSLHLNNTKEFCPFFSHFKIVYHPLKPVRTKAYLGFAAKRSASKIIRTKPLKH